MEVKDWTPGGKESFTTPGGPFRRPSEGDAKRYAFDRAEARSQGAPAQTAPRQVETPRPVTPQAEPLSAAAWQPGTVRPAQRAASPFAREAVPMAAELQRPAAAPIVLSHDGESVVQLQPDPGSGAQVYTIRVPQAPRPAPQKRQSLWWVPLMVLAALLLGLGLGVLLYPSLKGAGTSSASADPGSSETAAARIYREYADAVVGVWAKNADAESTTYLPASAATGFLISGDGYVLTNGHVVKTARQILVTTSDGQQHEARLVQSDMVNSDLALLKIEGSGLHAVTLGNSDDLSVGDWVATIGNPLGELELSLTTGYLSAGPRQINTGYATLTMLQTNAAINKGNSGGPLFDEAGRVVGVITAKYADYSSESSLEGLGFALPINDVMALAEAWLKADRSGPN